MKTIDNENLMLVHLSVTGPNKEKALVEFTKGLNVIYGASDTGKSFILEAINFILGGSPPLRDIPERVGYEKILLGVQSSNKEEFTLIRSISGGDINFYEGLHTEEPNELPTSVLKAKHSSSNSNSLSYFLLDKIGLANRRVLKNKKGETNNFTFRYLSHFILIDEGNIQNSKPPILTGHYQSKTPELSSFKLLITGVDDSSISSHKINEKIAASNAAKIEVLTELLINYKTQIDNSVQDISKASKDFSEQLSKLNKTLENEKILLNTFEDSYHDILKKRQKIRSNAEQTSNRNVEINEMLERFKLLDNHYNTDIKRLESINEVGSLMQALETTNCPLCGAAPNEQHLSSMCDGNVQQVADAALKECAKIIKLKKELKETVSILNNELSLNNNSLQDFNIELTKIDNEFRSISPNIEKKHSIYSELIEKKNHIKKQLQILSEISVLEESIESIDKPSKSNAKYNTSDNLSVKTLNDFSILLENILKKWKFPESDRIYFDKTSTDFILSGKPRGSRGKGMRAITHAAFTVALLKFTEKYNLPHPGFIILDTPLLVYREPENNEFDLGSTSVKNKFYTYLSSETKQQIIILENETPPRQILNKNNCLFFTKNDSKGRYGFFPRESDFNQPDLSF